MGMGWMDVSRCVVVLHLVKAIREITDTMLALNAAVNFVIYVVFNRGFRDRLVGQLCCRPVAACSRSTTCGRVLQPTGPGRRTDVAANNVEMVSPRGVTTSSGGSDRKQLQRRRRGVRHISVQTDL